jgi:hypothetical protein
MTHQQGNLELAPFVRTLVVLFADRRTDLLQLEPDGGHRVAARPEVLTREVALLAPKLAGNGNRTLSLSRSRSLAPPPPWGESRYTYGRDPA